MTDLSAVGCPVFILIRGRERRWPTGVSARLRQAVHSEPGGAGDSDHGRQAGVRTSTKRYFISLWIPTELSRLPVSRPDHGVWERSKSACWPANAWALEEFRASRRFAGKSGFGTGGRTRPARRSFDRQADGLKFGYKRNSFKRSKTWHPPARRRSLLRSAAKLRRSSRPTADRAGRPREPTHSPSLDGSCGMVASREQSENRWTLSAPGWPPEPVVSVVQCGTDP